MLKIYHNPRCRKSRETLSLIEESGKNVEVVEYLKTPPSKDELRDIIQKLDIKPEGLVRKSEALFKKQFKGKSFSAEEWLEILSDNPMLIERPIVVKGEKAVLGRPPESVKKLL